MLHSYNGCASTWPKSLLGSSKSRCTANQLTLGRSGDGDGDVDQPAHAMQVNCGWRDDDTVEVDIDKEDIESCR